MKLTPYVYLAVEKSRAKKGAVNQRWAELTGLCGRLGLGLITVTFYKTKAPFVEVLCEPEIAVQKGRTAIRRKERLLYEFRERSGDYNTGGVTRAKLVTAYREKTLRVAAAMNAAEVERRSSRELQEGHELQEVTPAVLPGISPRPFAIGAAWDRRLTFCSAITTAGSAG